MCGLDIVDIFQRVAAISCCALSLSLSLSLSLMMLMTDDDDMNEYTLPTERNS